MSMCQYVPWKHAIGLNKGVACQTHTLVSVAEMNAWCICWGFGAFWRPNPCSRSH